MILRIPFRSGFIASLLGLSSQVLAVELPALTWDELLEFRSLTGDATDASTAAVAQEVAALPASLRGDPELAELAVLRSLSLPEHYHGGVYGLNAGAKYFVAPTSRISDEDRLYAVMVRVLSEKFSCFMVTRLNFGDMTKVGCRDKRQVVFWKSRGPGWVQFYARQFDREGYEIIVRKRQIIRVSDRRSF